MLLCSVSRSSGMLRCVDFLGLKIVPCRLATQPTEFHSVHNIWVPFSHCPRPTNISFQAAYFFVWHPSFISVKSTKHVSTTGVHHQPWSTQVFQDIFYQLLHPFLFMVYIYCIIYRLNISNWVAYLTSWHGTIFSTKLCMRFGISLNISP